MTSLSVHVKNVAANCLCLFASACFSRRQPFRCRFVPLRHFLSALLHPAFSHSVIITSINLQLLSPVRDECTPDLGAFMQQTAPYSGLLVFLPL